MLSIFPPLAKAVPVRALFIVVLTFYTITTMGSLVLDDTTSDGLVLATSDRAIPILVASSAPEALLVAVETFADDVHRVVGTRPEVHKDTLPSGTEGAIIVTIVGDGLLASSTGSGNSDQMVFGSGIEGKWESYEVKRAQAVAGADEGLVIIGSDKVSPAG